MFEELEVVELVHDIKEHKLKVGDRGTVVFVYESASGRSKAYEVEFITPNGRTIAVLTLMPDDIRSTINKAEPIPYGYNAPISLGTLSSMTFTVSEESKLRRDGDIIYITKLDSKTKSKENLNFATL